MKENDKLKWYVYELLIDIVVLIADSQKCFVTAAISEAVHHIQIEYGY